MLFDKDGTLIDFTAAWVPAYAAGALYVAQEANDLTLATRLLRQGGYDPASDRFEPNTLLTMANADEIADFWAAEVGMDAAYQADIGFHQRINDIFNEHATAKAEPVTDLAALFGDLKGRGLKVGVATSDSTFSARATLERFGVAELVDFVTGFDGGHGVKPEAGMVRGFCTETGLEPNEVAVVGDTSHDMEMARAAGAGLAVGVLTGVTPRAELLYLADRVLDSIADIESVLD